MSDDWNRALEDLAASLVATITGCSWERRDFNIGNSSPDFALHSDEKEIGVLEVTRVMQQETLGLWAGIHKHGEVKIDGSRLLWVVWLTSDLVSVRRLTQALPALLREVEELASGESELTLETSDAYGQPDLENDLRERLRKAGVRRCSAIETDVDGSRGDVVILPRSQIGTMHTGLVTRDAETALNASDNRFKCSLRQPNSRGELFAWLINTPGDLVMTLPNNPMVGTDADAPTLPAEVTRIWVAAPPNLGETTARALWSSDGHAWQAHQIPELG